MSWNKTGQYNWAQETIQLATAQGSVCRTMPWLPTVQEASSRQQYTVKFNNNMCYSCDVALFNAEKPQDFVCSWTAEATTYLFNNKQFPPTLTCEMCYVVAVNKEQDKNNK